MVCTPGTGTAVCKHGSGSVPSPLALWLRVLLGVLSFRQLLLGQVEFVSRTLNFALPVLVMPMQLGSDMGVSELHAARLSML